MGAYWFRRGTQSQISMGQKPVTAYQSGATIKCQQHFHSGGRCGLTPLPSPRLGDTSHSNSVPVLLNCVGHLKDWANTQGAYQARDKKNWLSATAMEVGFHQGRV